MKELTILEELKTLLPPLTDDEYAKLEQSILKDGVLSPMIVWNDILVDGHHRYQICKKHQIPYAVKNVTLDSLENAKLWAWEHQDGRRNLEPYHRAELALRFKDAYATKAKERQIRKPADSVPQNFAEQNETRKELAQIAGVSHTTLNKVEFISEHADEETKDKLRRGEKGCSIHKEYQKLRKQQQAQSQDVAEQQVPATDAQIGFAPGSPEDEKYSMKTQLKPIPRNRPDILVANLMAFFPEEFVPNTAREIFRMLHERYGAAVTEPLAREMFRQYGKD